MSRSCFQDLSCPSKPLEGQQRTILKMVSFTRPRVSPPPTATSTDSLLYTCLLASFPPQTPTNLFRCMCVDVDFDADVVRPQVGAADDR